MTTTAWYIIPSKNPVARWFNILHWPYTLFHLSYVVIGASIAGTLDLPLLGWTVLAFFLGMGVAAHCFDLLMGDPLRLGLSRLWLWLLGTFALSGAASIGLLQILEGNVPWQLSFALPVGVVLALGYGKEWPGLHGDWQFAAWWAVFPLLVGYFAQGIDHHPSLIAAGAFAFCTAYAQRVLSTRARFLRRKVEGDLAIMTGFSDCLMVDEEAVGKDWMLQPLDQALMWLSAAMVTLAGGLLLWRVWG